MGMVEDIDDRVSVETRRESFRLVAGDDPYEPDEVEFNYRDLPALIIALVRVQQSRGYLKWQEKQR